MPYSSLKTLRPWFPHYSPIRFRLTEMNQIKQVSCVEILQVLLSWYVLWIPKEGVQFIAFQHFIFWPRCMTYGIFAPGQGWDPCPLHQMYSVLTTGLPGKWSQTFRTTDFSPSYRLQGICIYRDQFLWVQLW